MVTCTPTPGFRSILLCAKFNPWSRVTRSCQPSLETHWSSCIMGQLVRRPGFVQLPLGSCFLIYQTAYCFIQLRYSGYLSEQPLNKGIHDQSFRWFFRTNECAWKGIPNLKPYISRQFVILESWTTHCMIRRHHKTRFLRDAYASSYFLTDNFTDLSHNSRMPQDLHQLWHILSSQRQRNRTMGHERNRRNLSQRLQEMMGGREQVE